MMIRQLQCHISSAENTWISRRQNQIFGDDEEEEWEGKEEEEEEEDNDKNKEEEGSNEVGGRY